MPKKMTLAKSGGDGHGQFHPVLMNLTEISASVEEDYAGKLGDGCPQKPQDEKAKEARFRWIILMVKLTGLLFYTETRPVWRLLKVARAFLLVALAVYQTGFLLNVLLAHGTFDQLNARSMILFSWMLQALISIGFILYFQVRGHLGRLRNIIHCTNGCPLTPKVIQSTIAVYMSLLLITCLSALAVTSLSCFGLIESSAIIDKSLFEIYGNKSLWPLSMAIHFWAMYVWVAAMVLFICVVTALNHELCAFNALKLVKIGNGVEEGDIDTIGEQLLDCYVAHVDLANRVRVVNETFEVYAFTMLGSNVPTTIFCLLSFLLSYQHESWWNVAFGMPDLMFCLFELIGLTCAPAKVHATIRNVESIIYKNMRIWRPYSERVYRLASVFIAHANQSNLGITLWGFAVVTKPLILTMISLTISYLTFVLQARPERNGHEGNGTLLPFAFR